MDKKKILEVKSINKKIGKKQILKDISFYINEGDILGFIGPNGAGKTTAIKLILGLQSITSGEIYINGFNVEKNYKKAIAKVGAIVENPDSYMYLTGYDNLKMNARLYKGITKKRIEEVIHLVGLENRINDKVSKYSLGMRQRLGIAIALLHKPNLLVLDEPNNGLDPEGIRELRNLLRKLAREENIAIMIASHNLSEIESLCTTISIINKGEILETDALEHIRAQVNEKYLFKLSEIEDFVKLRRLFEYVLQREVKLEERDKQSFYVQINEEDVPALTYALTKEKYLIYEISKEKSTLEDAFISRTGGQKIE